jgi:hypothetical protein
MTIRRKVILLPQRLYTAWSALLPGTIAGGIGLLGTVLLVAFALVHGDALLTLRLDIDPRPQTAGRSHLHQRVLGPKLFLVPVVIGGAYAGAGYVSWMEAVVNTIVKWRSYVLWGLGHGYQ